MRPKILVALGATAAQTLLGSTFRLTKHRGEILSNDLVDRIVTTVHPSSILRAPDDETRRRELANLVEDLETVAHALRV